MHNVVMFMGNQNRGLRGSASIISSILLVCIPKCPLCLAAYSTLIATLGISSSTLRIIHILLGITLSISIICLVYRLIRHKHYIQSLSLITGTVLIYTTWIFNFSMHIKVGSLAVMIFCVLWSIRTINQMQKSNEIESCKCCFEGEGYV